jgi:hypothetical protein
MALDYAGLKAAVRDISPTQINDTAAGKAVNSAYQSLLRARPNGGVWFGLKAQSLITTLPDRTGGTVTLTQGSTGVVGVGTAFDVAVDPLRFLKIGGVVPLRIASVQSATQLTLAQAWGEATRPATTYAIMTLRYALPSDADRVTRLVGPQWPIKRMTFDRIDEFDPERTVRGVPLVFQEMAVLGYAAGVLAANVLNGQVSVPQGATSVTITFATSPGTSGYSVSGAPSWNTAWDVRTGRTATGFTIDFGVPAPAAGLFDWVAVVAGGASGVIALATTVEIELWPVPSAYGTFSLEYRKRVPDLVSDGDVPVLAPEVVRWAASAEMCNKLYTRTGEQTWKDASETYAGLASQMLKPVVQEDRKLRGSLRGVLDSDDVGSAAEGEMGWLAMWRTYGALFGT